MFDEALVEVVASWDDTIYRVRPDDKDTLVSLRKTDENVCRESERRGDVL